MALQRPLPPLLQEVRQRDVRLSLNAYAAVIAAADRARRPDLVIEPTGPLPPAVAARPRQVLTVILISSPPFQLRTDTQDERSVGFQGGVLTPPH